MVLQMCIKYGIVVKHDNVVPSLFVSLFVSVQVLISLWNLQTESSEHVCGLVVSQCFLRTAALTGLLCAGRSQALVAPGVQYNPEGFLCHPASPRPAHGALLLQLYIRMLKIGEPGFRSLSLLHWTTTVLFSKRNWDFMCCMSGLKPNI